MKLREVMIRFPETVSPSDTLIHARDRMVWGGMRHLPVLKGDKLVGVISDRDIAKHQARTGESLFSSPRDTVEMAMTSPAQTASPDDTVIAAMARLASDKIGCLPITESSKLVGLVTVTDLLVAEVRAHTEVEETGPTVADIMTRNPVITRAGERLISAAAKMNQSHVRHLPVVDDDGAVIGILSDRDVRAAIGDPVGPHAAGVQEFLVRAAMTSPALTVSPDRLVADVGRMFAGLGAGAFPVVDLDGKPLGIVSYVDVLRVYVE